jgi:hypothetical protein
MELRTCQLWWCITKGVGQSQGFITNLKYVREYLVTYCKIISQNGKVSSLI